jgi:hypothetical protein
VPVQGRHRVEVRDSEGALETAVVELSSRSLRSLPPVGKQKRYPALTLTVLHAREPEEPAHRPRIDWKLVTDLPVPSNRAAVEKLRWYALRWKIEVFHKVLKSGCRAEEARLRTAERLVRLIAVLCILGWRVFWMTMIGRSVPDAEPGLALTDREMALLDGLVPDGGSRPRTLALYLTKVARLGGYLARGRDPPPGNTVMWRGMSRLTDITLGSTVAARLVGNRKASRTVTSTCQRRTNQRTIRSGSRAGSVQSKACGSKRRWGSRSSTQRIGRTGKPAWRQTAVAEQISTTRSRSPYQPGTTTRRQLVASSASTSERFGRRAPLVRGRPTVPGRRGGAGSYSAASSRRRVMPVRPYRASATRKSKAAKLLSPNSTISRPGRHRRA